MKTEISNLKHLSPNHGATWLTTDDPKCSNGEPLLMDDLGYVYGRDEKFMPGLTAFQYVLSQVREKPALANDDLVKRFLKQ